MQPVFIYNTKGDWEATRLGNYIFNARGEWIAWLDGENVFTVDGEYAGYLSRDFRILRTRVPPSIPLRTDLPAHPGKQEIPARAPLPPMFAELSYSEVDMFEWDPDIFKRTSDLKPDLD